MAKKITLITVLCFFFFTDTGIALAQTSASGANYISTAVPFLTITPDSRAGGMGDTGVATSSDVNSIHWNSAKLAGIDGNYGISASYTPWLRDLINDMSLSYLTGYYRLNKDKVIGASFRYFSFGEVTFQRTAGEIPTSYKPNEWAFDITYSAKLGEKLSGGITFRYIRSDLTQLQSVSSVATEAGNAIAADISVFHWSEYNEDILWSWGISISNIGSKISYTNDDKKEFIPTNLKFGTALQKEFNESNSFTIAVDINKLLVPTSSKGILGKDRKNRVIVGSETSNKSVIDGIFGSFSDAPGGISEEFKEIAFSLGAEYWYHKQFALRGGYHYEHEIKGKRKYFTAGLGIKLNMFDLDFSYLIPTASNNPLKNTLRFSLTTNIGSFLSNEPKS